MNIKDFTHRVTPLKDRLYRFAIRVVDNVAVAEDVVQEVMIKLWHSREDLSNIKNLEAWSIRLTRNLSLDKLRSKHARTEQISPDFDLRSSQSTPQEIVESKDVLAHIHQLMQSLPEKQRMVIQLRDIEEMSYKEISEILEMPMSQVKVNLFRARKTLKEQLSEKKELYGL
jgi:RNA polymerase sigma-70 factor (ECF subfamily)